MKQHHFEIEHAEKYGVSEAIVINCFQYWIDLNRKNGRHQHDGRTWTYNSIKALNDTFSYWTPKQVRRVMESLEDKGVLITGNYNEKNYDKTKWYAFVNESEFLKPIAQKGKGSDKTHCPKGQSPLPKRANGIAQKGEPIPVNNQLITTVNNKETPIGFFDPAVEARIGKKHYELLCGAAIACNDSAMLNFLRESESAEILFDWLEYKKDKRQTYKTEHSVATLIEKKFMPFTPDELRQAYQDSVTANWAGIFPKKQNKKNAKDEPRFGAATHSEIERALEIRRARRQAV